jgi:Carboxypeptidase regulatory-like domain
VKEVSALVTVLALLLGTLHGQVMRGPITPVCRVGQPCDAPAKNVRLLFTRAGRTTSTLTDSTGRYRVRLAAGTYTVRTDQAPFGRVPQPQVVTVKASTLRRVDFHIDTGIR